MEELLLLKENENSIKNPSKIFDNIQKINIDFSQENFLVFYLDSNNIIINSEVLFKGGLNSCIVDPKTLFRKALLNNSNSLIIAHNHPSNNLNPSIEDKKVFEKLKRIGEYLNLSVLDSIIFNKKEYYSLNNEV